MKHYIAYATLVCVILLQLISSGITSKSESESWQYILREVIVDRDNWCIRQGFERR